MIKITARNLKEFQAFIKALPAGVKIASMKAIADYLVGNERHGLKHEPTWKFVSRARAYGKVSDAPPGYFSWAQFRFVAAITEGFTKIPYQRTHELANGWEAVQVGSDWQLVNDAPGANFVMGHNQANQPRLVGWRSYGAVIKANMAGAIRAGQAAVNKWIKSRQQ